MQLPTLMAITGDFFSGSHIDQARTALDVGVRCIQFRSKTISLSLRLQIAHDIKKICDTYNAILMINDSVEVCQAVSASGVHLGLTDTPISEARTMLGSQCIIGGTANTVNDVKQRMREGANYIGIGPYRYTQTKQNLSSILGKDGLLRGKTAAGQLFCYAIGGIKIEDVHDILSTGMDGIAISSGIYMHSHPSTAAKEYLYKTKSYYNHSHENANTRQQATLSSNVISTHQSMYH